MCQAINLLKEVQNNGAVGGEISAGNMVLIEVLHVHLHIRRHGITCDQFRMDFSNGNGNRIREHPNDVVEANMLMKYFNPIAAFRRKPNLNLTDGDGIQHLTDSEGERAFACFKCEHPRPDF